MALEGGYPYTKHRKVEDNLEKKLVREPNTWMFTNVSGTQHKKLISQVLSNLTLILVTHGSYQPKITTNLATEVFILELRDTGSQCGR